MSDTKINGLRPYTEYKDSGALWLGKVPDSWEVRRIKTLFRESEDRRGQRPMELLSLTRSRGLIPQSENSSPTLLAEDLSAYKVCRPTDVVMNRMQAWSGMFAVPSREGVVSPDYSVFTPSAACEIKFFEHLFKTPILVEQFAKASKGIGTGFNRLYSEEFGNITIGIPLLDEQAAIVRYLDDADQRIRAYVSAKERLIALLEEERQVVIQRAVTRGLDPNVKLKPSGVEWLGDVPEQWTVRRLKTLCSMKSGDGITTEAIEPTGRYPVYGGNGLRGYTTEFTHDGHYALIGRQGALCGNVHTAQGKFWASEHAVVASPHSANNMEWFVALLEAMNLNQYSISAAQPGIAVERIVNLWAPFPPHREQSGIGEYIAELTATINDAIDRARRQIELMEEYRTRLIADVVTGKIDVREAKP